MRLLLDPDDPHRSENQQRDNSNGSAAKSETVWLKFARGELNCQGVFDLWQNIFYTNFGVFCQHRTSGSVLLLLVISKSPPNTSCCSSLLLFRWQWLSAGRFPSVTSLPLHDCSLKTPVWKHRCSITFMLGHELKITRWCWDWEWTAVQQLIDGPWCKTQ